MTTISDLAVALPVRNATLMDPKDSPRDVREAAGQFEALLIAQMLRQVRESASCSWMGQEEDQASGSMRGLAEEQLAQALAARGGLGLANMVANGLAAE